MAITGLCQTRGAFPSRLSLSSRRQIFRNLDTELALPRTPMAAPAAIRPKHWARAEVPEAQDLLEGPEGPDIDGEELDGDEKKDQGDEASQDPQDHPLEEERDADEQVGGPDQPEDLDLVLPGEDVELDDVGDDEKGGQDEDAAEEEPDGPASRLKDCIRSTQSWLNWTSCDALEPSGTRGRRRRYPRRPGVVFLSRASRDGGKGLVLRLSRMSLELGEVLPEPLQGLSGRDGRSGHRRREARPGRGARAPGGRRGQRPCRGKKVTTMLAESWRATCWRLFERERKTPTMRNERQMIVVEKTFLPLYCQRLSAADADEVLQLAGRSGCVLSV